MMPKLLDVYQLYIMYIIVMTDNIMSDSHPQGI